MARAPSFKLTDVTKGVTYNSANGDILINRDYGGLQFAIGGMGRRSPFYLALNNLDGQLNDNTKNNGLKIEQRDEVKLYMTAPSQNVVDRLMYHGYVLKAARTISQDHEHVVKLSGISAFDFWNEGRYFERDYTKKPDSVSNVIKYALKKTHAMFVADQSLIPEIDTQVFKQWIACAPSDCLLEVCAAYNKELYIGPDDKPELYDYNSQSSGFTFDPSVVLGDGELYHSSEDSHYDEIKFMTNNPYFAPNNATPTTTSFTDDITFWRFLDPDFNFLVYFDPLNLDPSYPFYDAAVARAMGSVVTKAGLFAGVFQTIGVAYTQGDLSKAELQMSGSLSMHNTSGETRLGITEEDWETLNFTMQNGFKGPTSFKIKLYDDHAATGGDNNYWLSKELISDLSVGVVKLYSLFLPSHPDVEAGYWTAVGTPTKIDRVGFVWRGGSDYKGPTFLSNVFFQGMVRATATIPSPPAWPRQKIITDKTVSDGTDATNIAAAELTRLQNPAVLGALNVEGSPFYYKPGQTCLLNFTADGFSNVTARIDAIMHKVVENEYSCDIYFAPLMVKNSLWNKLAEISLRNNGMRAEDLAAAEAMVNNLNVS